MDHINLVNVDFNRDIQEISNYIQSYVDATYLTQIRSEITSYKRKCTEVPFPEVQLLKAVIPCIGEESRDKFQGMVDMITHSKMIEKMLPSYGVEKLFTRTENETKEIGDYIHQAVVVLVLYKVIMWAEGSHTV